MKTLIISGSSRKNGETAKIAQHLSSISGWGLIDLNDYKISFYDYEHKNKDDDYLVLMRNIIENYDTLIFATPVYWYSMSGNMKVFFDRITDLLTIEKDLGRKLRGKSMAVISSSGGDDLGDSFWLPFSRSAEYLGMKYLGNLHTYNGEINESELQNFVATVNADS
jgi:multimeric flavodoxin WrbA